MQDVTQGQLVEMIAEFLQAEHQKLAMADSSDLKVVAHRQFLERFPTNLLAHHLHGRLGAATVAPPATG